MSQTMDNNYTRRRLIEKGGVVGAVLLAGCTGGDTEPSDTETDPTTSDGTDNGDQDETETEFDTQAETETETESEDGTATAGEWPQFQFDAQNTGHNPDGTGPKQDIHARWQFEVGTAVRTAPVVKDGMVYVNADQLYALSTKDGRVEWTFTPSGGGSSPAVAEGTVFVSGDSGTLYAVDAENGSERWNASSGSGLSAPTVQPPRVFVVGNDRGAAFDIESGDELWSYSKGGATPTLPVVSDGVVYIVEGNGVLSARDVGDGSQQWTPGSDSPIPFTLVGDRIYEGQYLSIISIQQQDITDRLENEGMPSLCSPAATPGSLYVSLQNNTIWAVGTDGTTQWSFGIGADSKSAPALVDDMLYFGSNDRNVYAVDATSGNELWSFETGRIVQSPPAVAGGTVYIGSDDGYVYALAEE